MTGYYFATLLFPSTNFIRKLYIDCNTVYHHIIIIIYVLLLLS